MTSSSKTRWWLWVAVALTLLSGNPPLVDYLLGEDAKENKAVKDIIGRIETAVDNCEDVSNIIEGIVLKYS